MSGEREAPSLRREIVLWYSLVLLVALGIFAGLAYLLLQQALERTGRESLRQTAAAVQQVQVPSGIPRLRVEEVPVGVTLADGRTVEALRRRALLPGGLWIETTVVRGEEVQASALRWFLFISVLLIPLTAALAALGGRALVEALLSPLNRLVQATREIEIGGLSRRVQAPQRPAELQELAHSFNGMLTRLEGAVEALRRFTADASHELRTPLTGIRGTIQVALTRPRSTRELEDTLAEVLEETEWMLHLVDGLLTLARGEEDKALPERTPLDLVPLLHDVAEVGQALAAGKPVEVVSDLPDVLVVPGAAGPLRQVFLNLVSNAVKFTDAGRVAIRAGREEAPDGEPAAEGWAVVRVSDTGIGISAEELPRVFDRFYRGDAARARPAGTGLGLAIARLVAEQHGGSIDVSSAPGRGSEFRVRLPVDHGAAPTSAAQSPAPQEAPAD